MVKGERDPAGWRISSGRMEWQEGRGAVKGGRGGGDRWIGSQRGRKGRRGMKISLCMIVRDEEAVLDRCLSSVEGLVEEIILVDTGSQDGTKDIARRYTDRVYDFFWIDDFSAARNAAFSYATGDYVMWLDGDDVMEETQREAFSALRKRMEEEKPDVVMLPYQVGFDEKGRVTFSYYRERIVKNHAGFRWVGPVHEVMVPRGKILYDPCSIQHRKEKPAATGRNLDILEKALARGEKLDERATYYYGRELAANGRLSEATEVFQRVLKGEGWAENKIDACRQMAYCYKELGQESKAMGALVHSFVYDLPRGESCCDLGHCLLEQGRLEEAIYWYQRAYTAVKREEKGGFVFHDAYGYIPAIQLCVCYCHQENWRKAWDWNRRAGEHKPGDKAVEQNRAYLLHIVPGLDREEKRNFVQNRLCQEEDFPL